MKIKTITCHDVYNVGACLQAYALSHYLSEMGHDVAVIDYKPDYLSYEYRFWSVPNVRYRRNLLLKAIYVAAKTPNKLRFLPRKRCFDRFTRDYLRLTSRSYASNGELKRDCPAADAYIAGSDQIWNTFFPNGKDPAFYLDFAPKDARRFSYAASLGTDHIQESWEPFVSGMTAALNAVSVREQSAVDLLKRLGTEAVLVCDPVFLLDAVRWQEVMMPKRLENKPYLFVYDFDNNLMLQEATLKTAKKYGLKICSMFPSKIADRDFYRSGPREFLSLIYHADLILTNSFHAIAFSVIFEKPFWGVKRKENLNSRMADLLNMFSLEQRMVDSAEQVTDDPINYEAVRSKLNEFITASEAFLHNSLGDKNGD